MFNSLLSGIIKLLYKKTFQLLGFLPVDKRLVVFESFMGKQYSDNPRAIYEYMLENYPEYKLYWSFDRREINKYKNSNKNILIRLSPKWIFTMVRARYWVTNSRLPLWIPKQKHTIYVQTWHGTPLKKLAADMEEVHMPDTEINEYKEEFLGEVSKWDYLVSPNEYSTKIFRRAFRFEKTIIETGYPRNDYLFYANSEKNIVELKTKMNIPLNKKVILYAPTWRDNQFYGKGKYRFNLNLDLMKMRELLEEEYIIILRLHYLVSENLDLTRYGDFVFDFSKYEDVRDLYLVSDMLITDYSSVFFDYANLDKPILFYVYDIDDYRYNIRGFYFDLENEAPGPLFKNTEELIKGIKENNKTDTHNTKAYKTFKEKFCSLEDGLSTERVVKEIFK